MSKGTIIYFGRAEFPDKDATACRIVNNAKIFHSLGYKVVLVGWTEGENVNSEITLEGFLFRYWNLHKPYSIKGNVHLLFNTTEIFRIINRYSPNVSHVVMYNYPAFAFSRVIRFCVKNKITCLSDVTEWYSTGKRNLIFRLVRLLENSWRMRILNKKVDGLIVISDFLYDFYKDSLPVVTLPPLVDISDRIWSINTPAKNDESRLKLVFAGIPGKHKENLKLVVEAITSLGSIRSQIRFDVVGITEKEYRSLYDISDDIALPPEVIFHGKCDHEKTLKYVKNADYSVLIRPSNITTKAGFSTKFTESVSAGTPVIANDIGDVKHYITSTKCGILVDENNLCEELRVLITCRQRMNFDRSMFDYHRYIECVSDFLIETIK